MFLNSARVLRNEAQPRGDKNDYAPVVVLITPWLAGTFARSWQRAAHSLTRRARRVARAPTMPPRGHYALYPGHYAGYYAASSRESRVRAAAEELEQQQQQQQRQQQQQQQQQLPGLASDACLLRARASPC